MINDDPILSTNRPLIVLVGWFLALCLICPVTACHTDHPSHAPTSQAPAAPNRQSPSPLPPATSRTSASDLLRLSHAIERVDRRTAAFGLRDSRHQSMEALKIIPYSQGYLGVYHHSMRRSFEVRVATSTNLRVWHYWSALDVHASQPTLTALKGGGYLLAVEADKGGRLRPGRRWLRFRYYANLQELLSGRSQRSFDAPHTLTAADRGAEGTPNIYSATVRGDVAHSRITVGFHYLQGKVDREARGVLTDFTSWTTTRDRRLDRALDAAGMAGKHGDRDALQLAGRRFSLIEAQRGPDSFWRIALMDATTETVRLLNISTPGGSKSFANPTLMAAVLPDGRPGLVVTLYLPRTGAAPGEAGELIYYSKL